jgi:hypothetical protein
VRGLFKDAIIVSPDRRSTNASTNGILCCQKEATFNLKDEKSRIVRYFCQLILQTSGKGLVSPITTAPLDPETGFEEMNGGCLRADIRERKENSPEALSNFRAVVFSGSELRLRVAAPIAEKQAEFVLPLVNHQSSVAH